MPAVRMWFGLDLRRRARSVVALALLILLAAGTVLTAAAGARRASSAMDRLEEQTLPATSAILANTPGFDWDTIRAMPEVEALTTFVVDYSLTVELPGQPKAQPSFGFPFGPDPQGAAFRTVEKPIVYAGRLPDPTRADEVMVTRKFVDQYHLGVGDSVVIHLPTPEEYATVEPGPNGLVLHGPVVRARIVGVGLSPWNSDQPGSDGGLQFSPGLTSTYPRSVLGDTTSPDNLAYVNALVRLKGGEAAIPAFRTHFEQVTGRTDIDIWNLPEQKRQLQHTVLFEARCLLAFGLAAFVASLFLVGQAIVRYAAGGAQELRTLRAIGMTPRQAVLAAAGAPVLAGVLGGGLAVVAAVTASRWFPIGTVHYLEPDPGLSVDGLVLGLGWLLVVLLVGGGAALAARLALGAAPDAPTRRSAAAALVARAGVPVAVGTRFALEPGRGRTSVPVRPALFGAAVGVIGVLAVFTFSHGITDAATHPERFGQTAQAGIFMGINDQDFGPVDAVRSAVLSDPTVAGVGDGRTAVANLPDGKHTVPLWEYSSGRNIPTVMLHGRMPVGPGEVVLAPTTLQALDAKVGDDVTLLGDKGPDPVRLHVTGEGLIPTGPHNGYADGGWVSTAGYDHLFTGYKYRIELIAFRPGVSPAEGVASVHRTLTAKLGKDGSAIEVERPDPVAEMALLKQVRVLPVALGVFLVLLAIGAVGHALATAVRRRGLDLAVLRALGLTRWQSAGIVLVQATVLGIVGLLFGVPLGLALGRSVWRVVTEYAPLQYVSPISLWPMLFTIPGAVLVANLLAAWPGRRAAVLRVAHVLRAE